MKDEDKKFASVPNQDQADTVRASEMGWLTYLVLCAIGLILGLTSI